MHRTIRWLQAGRLALAVSLAAVPLLPRPVAAEVSDAQATVLEQQIHTWLGQMFGPGVAIGPRPVEVAAADDHYALRFPMDGGLLGQLGMSLDAPPVTAQARPLDGGRWALDAIVMPSPLTVSPKGGQDNGFYTVSMESQDQHAVLDPSLATASSFDGTITGYASSMQQPDGTSRTRIEQLVTHVTWQPDSSGKIGMLGESNGALLTVNAVSRDSGTVSLSAAKLRGTAHADGVALEQVRPLLHALIALAPAATDAVREAAARQGGTSPAKPAQTKTLSKAERAAVHDALTAMQALASGFGEDGTLDDVHIQTPQFSGHLARLSSGMGMTTQNGLASLRLHFAAEGIESPDLPQGVIRDYLPRHIALTQHVSGVPGAKLMALLMRDVDAGGNDPKAESELAALMQSGTVAAGFDELALDFGPATLGGNGQVRVLGKDSYSGDAHLSATGLDTLIQQAGSVPELAQAVPLLIFLKGIGRQDGSRVIWDITYSGKKLLVNGTDISEMMPAK